jgi:hypothetical protein
MRTIEVGKLADDYFVVVYHPRNHEVREFIRRVKKGQRSRPPKPAALPARPPVTPYPPVDVRRKFGVMPRLEALAVYEGERPCTNDDLIRNAAYSWSPMTAAEIEEKTGIRQRLYTELDLDHIALLAAQAALEKARRRPEEIGAVLFCSCTSAKMMPSLATWLSSRLGMFQTHTSCDIVAACAGLPYGLSEAVRLLQEVERPGERGRLDRLAEPGVRQQHHRLRPRGEGTGEALPHADDPRADRAAEPRGRRR